MSNHYLEITQIWTDELDNDELVSRFDSLTTQLEGQERRLDDLYREIKGIESYVSEMRYDVDTILSELDERGSTTLEDRFNYSMECAAERNIGRSSSDW